MVPATSLLRGTPTLTVAPTQNTAPVHEFRCLYTRDLHKKSKKWHDGSLRFHTFNRRVMVYDDAKNYIGDLHYRQEEEEFGEGVELQLDRGVKVEVGDRLGETETDLAPILDRQRPEKATSQARQAAGLTPRLNSSLSSQRPKSLLEVLGPSQGRLGRSRLPLQSPYEQRQAFSRPGPSEPSPKRLRLFNDKENQPNEVPKTIRPSRPCLPQPVRPDRRVTPPARRTDTQMESREVVDISSGEDIQQSHRKEVRTDTLPPARPVKLIEKPQSALRPTASSVNQKSSKGNNVKPRTVEPIAPETTPQYAVRPSTEATSRRSRASVKRNARLLLVDPLPSCSPAEKLDDTHRPRSMNGPSAQPMDTYSCSQIMADDQGFDFIDCSPLFVPKDGNEKPRSPSPSSFPSQEEFSFPGFSMGETSLHADSSNTARDADPKAGAPGQVIGDGSRSPSADAPAPSCVSPELRPEDSRPPLELGDLLRLNSTTRNFRRVFSENDAIEDDELHVPMQGGIESRSPLKILNNLSVRRSPVKSRSPKKLQRCASDTAAFDSASPDQAAAEQEPSKGATGPWTSEEAFLLFDWWPAEVEKPGYWTAIAEKASGPAPVSAGAISAYPTIITTARQFLRDDVNAL
ncbi:hypothetical protein LTR93_003571 [Exophiala xenobiotica]|nr:hypothetical protein LTR93_003571 [Exophiala xenobiotica]KAK5407928.1 hypothetical protein LTR06_007671 [Exophiala xenobiotica]